MIPAIKYLTTRFLAGKYGLIDQQLSL